MVAVFSQFGKVIDVVAAKTYKLRGQAWVVFDNVASATAAVRGLQDFPFYDKPMRITYAKSKSDATAKLEGTYDPATRDPEVRAKRKAESQRAEREARAKKEEAGEGAGPGTGTAIPTDPTAPPNEILFVQGLPGTPKASRISRLVAGDRVRRRVGSDRLEFATSATRARVFSSSDSTLHIPIKLSEQRVTTKHLRIEDGPRRVLVTVDAARLVTSRVSWDFFASTRPRVADLFFVPSSRFPPRRAEATTAQMLSMLFQQFPGFKEVRMVEAKPGIAFVEFDTETQASVALSGLQGFKINPTHSMTLSYAKK